MSVKEIVKMYTQNMGLLLGPALRVSELKMNTALILRDNLLLLMSRLDISQPSAAKRCGVSQKTINNIVNIGTNPTITNVTLKNIEKIAQGFQVTVPELLSPSLSVSTIKELTDSKFKEVLQTWLTLSDEGKDRLIGAITALKLVYANQENQDIHDRLTEKVEKYNAKQNNISSATNGVQDARTTEEEYIAELTRKLKP